MDSKISQNRRGVALPQLRTKVGFCGTVTRQEVGGPVCLGVFVGIVIG